MAYATLSRPGSSVRTYHRVTRTGTYGYLMAIPLLVLYEVMVHVANGGNPTQIRVGAEVWIKRFLGSIGISGWIVLSILILVVGAAILYTERRKHIPIRASYFGWMVLESAAYAVVVAFFVSNVVGILFAFAPVEQPLLAIAMAGQGLLTRMALSIGAGLYEELFFRVLLVGGLFLLMAHLFKKQGYAYVVAAIIGALLFSAVHYIGALGDAFALPSFTFRFIFGLVLNVLFLARGFGIAAWTHALYDVMIVTGLLA